MYIYRERDGDGVNGCPSATQLPHVHFCVVFCGGGEGSFSDTWGPATISAGAEQLQGFFHSPPSTGTLKGMKRDQPITNQASLYVCK